MSGGIPRERMTPEEIARLKLRCTNRDGSAEVLTSKAWAHITLQDAENAKLRAALHEAADELDGYYRAEYCGDHPYSKRKLAEAMRQNPARIALKGK